MRAECRCASLSAPFEAELARSRAAVERLQLTTAAQWDELQRHEQQQRQKQPPLPPQRPRCDDEPAVAAARAWPPPRVSPPRTPFDEPLPQPRECARRPGGVI